MHPCTVFFAQHRRRTQTLLAKSLTTVDRPWNTGTSVKLIFHYYITGYTGMEVHSLWRLIAGITIFPLYKEENDQEEAILM